MHGFKIEIWLQFVFDPKCSAVKPCCSEHKVVVFVFCFFVKMPILHVKAFNNFCRAWSQLYHLLYFFIYLNQALGARQVFIPLTECVVLSLNCVLSKIVENIKKKKTTKTPLSMGILCSPFESINKFVLHVLTGLIESPSQTSAWESTWWVRMTFWKTREEVQLTSVRMY